MYIKIKTKIAEKPDSEHLLFATLCNLANRYHGLFYEDTDNQIYIYLGSSAQTAEKIDSDLAFYNIEIEGKECNVQLPRNAVPFCDLLLATVNELYSTSHLKLERIIHAFNSRLSVLRDLHLVRCELYKRNEISFNSHTTIWSQIETELLAVYYFLLNCNLGKFQAKIYFLDQQLRRNPNLQFHFHDTSRSKNTIVHVLLEDFTQIHSGGEILALRAMIKVVQINILKALATLFVNNKTNAKFLCGHLGTRYSSERKFSLMISDFSLSQFQMKLFIRWLAQAMYQSGASVNYQIDTLTFINLRVAEPAATSVVVTSETSDNNNQRFLCSSSVRTNASEITDHNNDDLPVTGATFPFQL